MRAARLRNPRRAFSITRLDVADSAIDFVPFFRVLLIEG